VEEGENDALQKAAKALLAVEVKGGFLKRKECERPQPVHRPGL